MFGFLNKFGIVVTRSRNVIPEKRMNVSISRELNGVNLFVDVGANSGQTYNRIRTLGFSGTYLAIEPEFSSFQKLLQLQTTDKNLICISQAIGKDAKVLNLNISNNEALSSSLLTFSEAHRLAAPEIDMVDTQSVPVSPLSAILDKLEHSSIFLKIDVQGYELEVLKGINDFDWGRICGLLIECNLVSTYEGSAFIEEVFSLLRQKGFHPYRLENGFGATNFGQQLQVDVLFKRLQ
jgi:FkbM family methyltransferase